LAVGEADDSITGCLHLGVAGSVALKGCSVAVEFPAVHLDDEAMTGPVGVDLVVEDRDIGERGG
jgi:hypothetical protein